ncbi:MarR family winged helix-turn-helix transcriptional regulator [Hydrogenophaga sp. A37]|uniref:MarR family winged helix-turn-helix transcriptional regulator n=1 Tax=Hydrogenophaga sp. A37 TaxID=1945864 RepID=UPI00209B6E10|nr:MarR family transcriptional regulator [Hydrogenophaga sp. A37]
MKHVEQHATSKDSQTPRARLDEGALRQLLGYQLAQASIVTNSAFSHATGEPLALGQVEFTLLYLIRQNTSVTASRLARALAVSMPAITVWMSKLEQRGLVSRQRSATDKRSQHFGVTDEGEALVARAMTALLEADARLLAHLSQAERAMLLELLHKVALHRPG